MRELNWKITKEEYERYTTMDSKIIKDTFEKEKVPIDISCGYGFYGVRFWKGDETYFAILSVGDTCD